MPKQIVLIPSLLLLCAFSAGATSLPGPSDYRIGPRDLLEIRVFQDPNLNTEVRVNDQGEIRFPLLGNISVANLTSSQVEDLLKRQLESQYITRADVSVGVKEYENQPISVFGSVGHPGKIPISGNMTLIQAITAAGGLLSGSKHINILRTASNGLSQRLIIDADELMLNGDPDVNVPVAPNDIINVVADTQISVYVLGEVMRPGMVQFHRSQNPSLLQALAGAGGLTDRASKGSILIRRKAGGRETTIKVNLKPILAGRADDFILMENDTIYVKESFF